MIKKLLMTLILCLLLATGALAEDIYVGQSAAGGDTGANCANQKSASWFNTAGSWSNTNKPGTTGKIGAGDTVHICGTFTVASGNILTVQASGFSGNPITIKFEDNAILQAAYFGANGAIYASGKNYITVDGGTNGIIRATNNGSASLGYANQTYSNGVAIVGCSDWEIKNLTISNMYVRAKSDTVVDEIDGSGMDRVYSIIVWNTGSRIYVHNNTTHDAACGFQYGYAVSATIDDIKIYNNTMYNHSQHIAIVQQSTNAALTNIYVYGSNIYGGTNWLDPADRMHADCIMLSVSNSGNTMDGVYVYNNYIHPDYSGYPADGSHVTAFMFFSQDPGSTFTNVLVYNNVFTTLDSDCLEGSSVPGNGIIEIQGGFTGIVSNNTIVSCGSGCGIRFNEYANGGTVSFINNIVYDTDYYVTIKNSTLGTLDYNIYYSGSRKWYYGEETDSIATWRTNLGGTNESHSSEVNPSISLSTYAPDAANDPPVNAGTSMAAYYTIDKNGYTRNVGTWDIGAYEYGSGGSVSAPTLTGVTFSGKLQ